ncbi:HlyD family efflux transporter periplasmic adaptor subunit [Stenomitos frigidus]|uniref:HlyD family efflux transporter periplasmic adaptor subunit n=1 Tax=Stenomitos frigidus TaxID=1886765 RepID=UPI001C624AE7|nr:HlyD family efflux transporter periplasmic adaptor subunit [Stenomitos frigidus]
MTTTHPFDRPVILKRSPLLSRAIVWGLISVTSFGFVWASVAKIEESIPATGILEPQGAVKEIKVPIDGVVKAVYVVDGQQVKQGDRLLSIDPTVAQAQLISLQKICTSLMQENQFYYAQIHGLASGGDQVLLQQNLPAELVSLTQYRSTLVTEIQLDRAALNGSTAGMRLTSEQQLRLRSSQVEQQSRSATVQLDTAQIKQQLKQNQLKLASAKDNLVVNEQIFRDLALLAKEGGISRLQYLRQQQEVRNLQSEVDQLMQEQERLKLAIAQSQQKVQNTLALSTQDLLTKISNNEQKIAEIDSQLNKAIVENKKKIAEIDSQISQAKVTLQYQELRASVAGIVFDLKASNAGFVTNSSEPILKLVPENAVVAKVYITNKDIGFVQTGMPVDVRIDSFPFSEFGGIKGQLTLIGSDALPPTQTRPVYSFPANVQLDQQLLLIQGRQVPLRSGMSVSVNIKVRQRTVMSIFTDGFTKQVESLRTVR